MKTACLPALLVWAAVALAGTGLALVIWQSVSLWGQVFSDRTYSIEGPSSVITWSAISLLLFAPLALTIWSTKIGRVERRWLLRSASVLSILWIIYPSVCIGALYSRQNQGGDATDTKALAAYQTIKPGTPVIVVLKVRTTFNGVDVSSSRTGLDQEGTVASITDGTLALIVNRNGHAARLSFAGRMIREIRVKDKPNHTAEPVSPSLAGSP